MNIKRQLSALQKRDFSNKTMKQNAKYLVNKLNLLGYKAPKYLLDGQYTEKQLNLQINKIENKLRKMIMNESKKELSPEDKKKVELFEQVEKQNKKIDRIEKELKNNHNLSNTAIEYIMGKEIYLNSRDKSYKFDIDLHKLSLGNLYYKDIDVEIKRIKALNRKLTVKNVNEKIKEIDKGNSDFIRDLFEDNPDTFTKDEVKHYMEVFNELTLLQKELFIKDTLSEQRERYYFIKEEFGEEYDDSRFYTAILRSFNENIEFYKKL